MTIRRQDRLPQIRKDSIRAFRVDVHISSYTDTIDASVRTHITTKIHFSYGVFGDGRKRKAKTTQYLLTKSAGFQYNTRPSYAFIIEPSNDGLSFDVINKFRNPSGHYDKGGPYHRAVTAFINPIAQQYSHYSRVIPSYGY